MAISFVALVTLVSYRNEAKKMARPSSVFLIVMCCARYPPTPPLLSSFRASSVSSLFAMPKVDPRNEVGAIVHAVSNRVLSNHTAKNIYGNVNYAKTFLQGTVVNVFDGRVQGGKKAIWKLTVDDFEMHSEEPTLGVELKRVAVHWQHCTLGPVPAGKNPQCFVHFTDLIGEPDHAVKGSTTYLPNTEGRAATSSTIAAASTAPRILLSPASHIAETAGDEIEVIIVPPALTPMDAAPHAATRTKKKRKKATPAAAPAAATNNASTATPTLTTAPATKKGKMTG
jgi:hypothetical protein